MGLHHGRAGMRGGATVRPIGDRMRSSGRTCSMPLAADPGMTSGRHRPHVQFSPYTPRFVRLAARWGVSRLAVIGWRNEAHKVFRWWLRRQRGGDPDSARDIARRALLVRAEMLSASAWGWPLMSRMRR
jgi:hypothetical protein